MKLTESELKTTMMDLPSRNHFLYKNEQKRTRSQKHSSVDRISKGGVRGLSQQISKFPRTDFGFDLYVYISSRGELRVLRGEEAVLRLLKTTPTVWDLRVLPQEQNERFSIKWQILRHIQTILLINNNQIKYPLTGLSRLLYFWECKRCIKDLIKKEAVLSWSH